jgi:GNAT superfamily N-acetyltransferase
MTEVRLAEGPERVAALGDLTRHWGDPIVVRGEAYPLAECEIFLAGDGAGLAAVSTRDAPIAELVAINAFEPGKGFGTALLRQIVARLDGDGFRLLRVVTTNDNLTALRFYQRHGFRLAGIRFGAVDAARRLKPSIPVIGDHGIPIRDEIELMLDLG